MKGYLLAICKTLVVAIWLGLITNTAAIYEYPVVRFTLIDATGQTYSDFIDELRSHLVTGDDVRHGIPVLRSTVDIAQRFILVELTNRQGVAITVAVNVINVYVVGYRAGNNAVFFRPDNEADAQAITHLFTDAIGQNLGNGGNYDDLQHHAGDRSGINLGVYALDAAISALHDFATGGHGEVPLDRLLRSFIVGIQMIAEAARFNLIRNDIRVRIEENQERPPDPRILSLENNWGSLSEQIQTSNQGAFVRAVQLRQRNDQPFDVDSLTQALIRNMGLLLYFCTTPSMSNRRPRSATTYDVCDYSEPIVRIAGPNGLCVDVNGGRFDDGNSIILFPCKTNTDANQLWTLKRDGTIRSNDKCLTARGNTPGVYIMINDCNCAAPDTTYWKVWDNGTIINPASSLVLAANSWDQRTTLSVETNVYTTSQSWRPTNNTQPFVASIVGFKDLCLHANGENVWVEECVASKKEQQWALYPDGSIRPQEKQQYCLNGDAELVKILSCKPGSSAQRWAFENDGSILNLNTKWVLDVRRSDPSLKQILIWPNYGTKNQKWNVVY